MGIKYNEFVIRYQLDFKNDECLSSDEKKQLFFYRSNLYNNIYYGDFLGGVNYSRKDSRTMTYYYKSQVFPVGAGLANLTNTCFLNSIMQCLTHTVVFVQGVLSLKHQPSIHNKGFGEFCVLCAVRDQIELSFAYSGRIISPKYLVDNLNNISSSFITNQQEDAHEFLQCLLNQLDNNWSLFEASAIDASYSDDPLVKHIFGGSLVSQVQCRNCGHNSETNEALIDLSLEIEDVDSVKNALKSFTKVESIENFRCAKCEQQVQVDKRLLLDKVPAVAALHLKRFKSDGFNVEKINKMVEYELELDLAPYTKGYTNNENESLKYELYAFVVHVGYSATSGHYFCYIRTSPEEWYLFNDQQIAKVVFLKERVMHEKAYILFYARQGTPWFGSMIEQWRRVCFKGLSFSMDIPTTSYPTRTSALRRVEDENKDGIGIDLHGCEAGTRKIEQIQQEVEADDDGWVSFDSCLNVPINDTKIKDKITCSEVMDDEEWISVETCTLSTSVKATSPVIFSDVEPAEKTYGIPTENVNLKIKHKSSGKTSMNNSKQNMKKNKSVKYRSKSAYDGGRCRCHMSGIRLYNNRFSIRKRRKLNFTFAQETTSKETD